MHKRGYDVCLLKIFCLTVPKKFVGELFCFRKYLVSKNFMHRRGYHDFVEYFLSHSTEPFRRRTLLCFRKFWVSKIFIDKRVGMGGVSRFTVVLIKLKTVGKGWDSNPYLALLLSHPMCHGNLKFLTNTSKIIKIYGPTEIRTGTFCLRIFCPHRTAGTICLKKNSLQTYTEKKQKKKYDPTIMNEYFFFHIYNMQRKIKKT